MNKVTITTKDGKKVIAKTKFNPFVKFNQVGYCFIFTYKDNEFLKQFYHGEKGIIIGSEKYKEIRPLEKQYANHYLHELLGANVQTTKIDGRTKEAKNLPCYTIDMLI